MTAFSEIMETLEEAERGVRFWDGDRLRIAAERLTALAAVFPPETCDECGADAYWHTDVKAWFHRADVADRGHCRFGDGPVDIDKD